MIQFLQATKDSVNVTKEVVTAIETGHTEQIIEKLIDLCIGAGKNILIAIVVYFVGRFLISLLQRLMANMLEWTASADDENYTLLKSMYNGVTGQHLRYIFHAMKYIGGRYTNDAPRSEGLDNYIPVEKEKQEAAMEFLKKYLFNELPWLYDSKVAHLCSSNIDRYRETIMGKCLAQLITSLQYLSKDEVILGDKAYTCKNLTDDLYEAVWGSLSTSKALTPFERMMQRNYLSGICILVESGPMEVVPELLGLYVDQMDRIVADAKRKIARTNDFMTKSHLQGVIRRIEECQKGESTTE